MNFKSYIDAIKYKKMGNESCFIIGGWCFSVSGEKVEYQVLVNGKAVKFDIQKIARRDVTQKMAKYQPELSCGFSMTIPVNPEVEAPKALELYAVSGNEKKKIVSLNEAKIEKITDTRSISYHLEYVRPEEKGDAVKYSIGGWAISEKKARDMEYQILDASGQDVDKTVRMVNRDDLYKLGMVDKEKKYCGFIVEFLGDQDKTYTFVISDGYNSVRKKIVYKEVVKANRRLSQVGTVKMILHNLNGENIVKGCAYLKKNGAKKLISRLKKGVHVNGIPYSEWYEAHKVTEEELKKQRKKVFEYQPKFSIIVPTYNTPIPFLREMIDSVVAQTYPNWELCIGDGSEGNPELEQVLAEYAAKDTRIKYQILEKNFGIAGNTNGALELATGEYVGLFDHDDILGPNALFEVTKALQKKKYDILYTEKRS